MSEKLDALKTKPGECKYSFFSHKECEFFPCHKGIPEEDFNCLFCYCPLYALGKECGGNYRYLDNGIKDCSACTIPHRRSSYSYIVSRYGDIVKAMARLENSGKKTDGDEAE